ncbi:MAG: hypothetical protein H7A21_03790 [Spirochaetales bacterium]|nr:hypothetical protein [Leptospiraceae bacterium]MCP5480533.1 hypothetical protein [Spirochaetales bacterium]
MIEFRDSIRRLQVSGSGRIGLNSLADRLRDQMAGSQAFELESGPWVWFVLAGIALLGAPGSLGGISAIHTKATRDSQQGAGGG